MEMKVNAAELLKTLKALPAAMTRRVLTKSLRLGAVQVQRAAKQNAKAVAEKEVTGTMVKNIVVNKLKNKNGMLRYAVRIRPKAVHPTKRDKEGNPVRVGLYAAVLEYGKANQPPRSWIRKAARESANAALNAVTEGVKVNLTAAVEDAKR